MNKKQYQRKLRSLFIKWFFLNSLTDEDYQRLVDEVEKEYESSLNSDQNII